MDRFIASLFANCFALSRDLKSNMDRFIVCPCQLYTAVARYLKSNMDRFIGGNNMKKTNWKSI